MIVAIRLNEATIGAVEVPNQFDRETISDLFLQWHTSVIGVNFNSMRDMMKSMVIYYASHRVPCRQIEYMEIQMDDVVAVEKEMKAAIAR